MYCSFSPPIFAFEFGSSQVRATAVAKLPCGIGSCTNYNKTFSTEFHNLYGIKRYSVQSHTAATIMGNDAYEKRQLYTLTRPFARHGRIATMSSGGDDNCELGPAKDMVQLACENIMNEMMSSENDSNIASIDDCESLQQPPFIMVCMPITSVIPCGLVLHHHNGFEQLQQLQEQQALGLKFIPQLMLEPAAANSELSYEAIASARRHLATLFLGNLQVPRLCLIPSAVLAVLNSSQHNNYNSSSKTTGIVIDSGKHGSCITIVVNGLIVKSIYNDKISGDIVTRVLGSLLSYKLGLNIDLYSDDPQQFEMIETAKHKYCKVKQIPNTKTTITSNSNKVGVSSLAVTDEEGSLICEYNGFTSVKQEQLIRQEEGNDVEEENKQAKLNCLNYIKRLYSELADTSITIPQMVYRLVIEATQSTNNGDVLKQALLSNVCIVGGNCRFTGYAQRLEYELVQIFSETFKSVTVHDCTASDFVLKSAIRTTAKLLECTSSSSVTNLPLFIKQEWWYNNSNIVNEEGLFVSQLLQDDRIYSNNDRSDYSSSNSAIHTSLLLQSVYNICKVGHMLLRNSSLRDITIITQK